MMHPSVSVFQPLSFSKRAHSFGHYKLDWTDWMSNIVMIIVIWQEKWGERPHMVTGLQHLKDNESAGICRASPTVLQVHGQETCMWKNQSWLLLRWGFTLWGEVNQLLQDATAAAETEESKCWCIPFHKCTTRWPAELRLFADPAN